MRSGSSFESDANRQKWRQRRVLLALGLLPLILVMVFRVWLDAGALGVVLAALFTIALVTGIALQQKRKGSARHELVDNGGPFEAPAVLRLEQLLASIRFASSVESVAPRLRRRGWGQVGGRLAVDEAGISWFPDRPASRRGFLALALPWEEVADVALVPMAGIGDGVGLELQLSDGSQLSIHTADIAALRTVLERWFRITSTG